MTKFKLITGMHRKNSVCGEHQYVSRVGLADSLYTDLVFYEWLQNLSQTNGGTMKPVELSGTKRGNI
jgi:hypothetical protein